MRTLVGSFGLPLQMQNSNLMNRPTPSGWPRKLRNIQPLSDTCSTRTGPSGTAVVSNEHSSPCWMYSPHPMNVKYPSKMFITPCFTSAGVSPPPHHQRIEQLVVERVADIPTSRLRQLRPQRRPPVHRRILETLHLPAVIVIPITRRIADHRTGSHIGPPQPRRPTHPGPTPDARPSAATSTPTHPQND